MKEMQTTEKIRQMAEMCIQCRRCMKECIMLRDFTTSPKRLFENYLDRGIQNMDPAIAYSCNECSQCTLACPRHLDLKEIFIELKKGYAAENSGIVPLDALVPSEAGQVKECDETYCTTVSGAPKNEDEMWARRLETRKRLNNFKK